jgi:hypothetical protein
VNSPPGSKALAPMRILTFSLSFVGFVNVRFGSNSRETE